MYKSFILLNKHYSVKKSRTGIVQICKDSDTGNRPRFTLRRPWHTSWLTCNMYYGFDEIISVCYDMKLFLIAFIRVKPQRYRG